MSQNTAAHRLENVDGYTVEQESDTVITVRTDGKASVGGSLTADLLNHGFAVESCYEDTIRFVAVSLEGGQLGFGGE